MSRYTIYCKDCESDVVLLELGAGDYECNLCGRVYTDEDGIIDNVAAADYYAQYKGAVRAGMIPDPEWKEYDNERR